MMGCKKIKDGAYARNYFFEVSAAEIEAYYAADSTARDSFQVIGRWPDAPVRDEQRADGDSFLALCKGLDPRDGTPVGQVSCHRDRVAAFDLTASAPKSVSALFAVFGPADQERIRRIHRSAIRTAVEFGLRNGAFVVRKDGVRERAVGLIMADFQHHTNRDDQPQVHEHPIIFARAMCADGKIRALDSKSLLTWIGGMAAVYRAELAAGLQDELGVATRKVGRNFEIDGVATDIIDMWSSRRQAILAKAAEEGVDITQNRGMAQKFAVETRKHKTNKSSAELEAGWKRDLASLNVTAAGVLKTVRNAALGKARHDPHVARQQAVEEALKQLTAHRATFQLKDVYRLVAEHLQGLGRSGDVEAAVDQLLRDGRLKFVGHNREGRQIFSTPEMIAAEKRTLRNAIERKGEREWVSRAAVEFAIVRMNERLREKSGNPDARMRADQEAAIWHAAGPDGVSVVMGRAGVGKTTAASPILEAFRLEGYDIVAAAPSGKARNVLAADTGADAVTVQRLVGELESGKRALSSKTVIFIDEAGMVPTRDLDVILAKARAAGSKVILSGDTRQHDPVGAGSPLSAIIDKIGTSEIREIQRQKVEWQRQASMALSQGNPAEALHAYDRNRRVAWAEDRDLAIDALVADWRRDLRENPNDSRIVITGRHQDIRDLNAALRRVWREEGRLSGQDFTLRTRHKDGHVREGSFAVGDRIIFTELVRNKKAGIDIANGDIGTIEAIHTIAGGEDATIRIRFNEDRVVRARLSELAGWNKDRENKARVASFQHAYACTSHASQGDTVTRSFVFFGGGQNGREFYVNLTRHVMDAKVYMDCDRLRDTVWESRAMGDDRPITHDDVMRQAIKEISNPGGQANVSDFVAVQDFERWLYSDMVSSVAAGAPPEAVTVESRENETAISSPAPRVAPLSVNTPPRRDFLAELSGAMDRAYAKAVEIARAQARMARRLIAEAPRAPKP